MHYLVLVSVTLHEIYIYIYDKQLLINAISDTIFQFLFSDIYFDFLNKVLPNRRKKANMTSREQSQVKNQRNRYSEGYSLKYTICKTLHLLHENINKISFIHRNKRVAGRWWEWIFQEALMLRMLMLV